MSQKILVTLTGMTCRSCEVSIEQAWRTVPGVKNVAANFAKNSATLVVDGVAPSNAVLEGALDGTPYRVKSIGTELKNNECAVPAKKLSIVEILGLFALVFILLGILSKLGWLGGSVSMNGALTFGAVFLIGLVAASSSCIAVTGGLLLSLAASYREKFELLGKKAPFQPVALFVLGRIVGYTFLGGVLGAIGGELTISPIVTGVITFIAAAFMLLTGLNLLRLLPNRLQFLLPRVPRFLTNKILDARSSNKTFAPLILGALTFFLPCGFTQSLQLYALATGSFTYGALTMLAFSLGTAPALLALGFATNLGGKVGKFFHSFAGALVVVLGVWNIGNALAIVGYPISFTSAQIVNSTQIKTITSEPGNLVPVENGSQIARMVVDGVYKPDHFTLKAGIPVIWEVDGTKAGGCTGVLTSRALGVQKFLEPGINTITFTPKEPGEIKFACSMGMVRGSFTVIP